MRIKTLLIITNGGDLTDPSALSASQRIQLKPALTAAMNCGYQIQQQNFSPQNVFSSENRLLPAITIVGKLSLAETDSLLQVASATIARLAIYKAKKIPIILTYNENKAIYKDMIGNFYRDLITLSDHYIVPTNKLYSEIINLGADSRNCHVINDPWQVSFFNYKEISEESVFKIIWFGHETNLRFLFNILQGIISNCHKSSKYSLTILTNEHGVELSRNFISNLKLYGLSTWKIHIVTWNNFDQPRQLNEELNNAHLSIIPSDPSDPRKCGVSHNRIVDSIRSGCLVCASPMESYKELEEISILGEDFVKMIDYAYSNYNNLISTYRKKRKNLIERFSPKISIKSWEDVINGVCKNL